MWTLGRLLFLLTTVYHGNTQGGLPQTTPFFFLCNYHGNTQELGRATDEVKLSVSIQGNPDMYVPGQLYEVSVVSSLNFDGFFLTGLYTIAHAARSQMRALGMQGGQPVGQNHMCSVVHSISSRDPIHDFRFVWIAPPSGTGCVSFVASATLHGQTLFKDTTVLQLCEQGAPTLSPPRPIMAALHTDSLVFRDDFDSTESFSSDMWMSHEGGTIGRSCGSIFYGDAAVMCNQGGLRELITNPLNTTFAGILQFTLGAGSCTTSDSDQDITVLFGLNNCRNWFEIDRFRPPTTTEPKQYLLHLPSKARGIGICFAFKQAPTLPRPMYATETTTKSYVTPPKQNKGLALPGVLSRTVTKATTKPPETTAVKTTPPQTYPDTTTYPYYDRTTTEYLYNYLIDNVEANDESYVDYFNDGPVPLGSSGTKTKTGASKTKAVYNINKKTSNKNLAGGEDDGLGAGEQGVGTYQGCWAIDHVIITNMIDTPEMLQDSMDPVDPSDWLYFPGAHFKQHCHSDDTAMVFNHESPRSAVGTRDINLATHDISGDIILQEHFESKTQPGWILKGGYIGVTCGIIYDDNAAVFDGSGKSRKICTPLVDLTKAGNVRFYFAMGTGECNSTYDPANDVIVFLEDAGEHTLHVIDKLNPASYKVPRLVSLPLTPLERHTEARICWLQKRSGGKGQNVWALDNVHVLPYLPKLSTLDADKMAQFSMNLHCGNTPENNEVVMSYSTNQGESWFPLHTPCLPGQCAGNHFPTNTDFHGEDYGRWSRVTVPLPYAAMVDQTRFQWEKVSKDNPNWALDNVFIGNCPDGCNNHGNCVEGSCQCDFGFTGPACKESINPNPELLLENFEGTSQQITSAIGHISGASLGYDCDVLSSGRALVFNKDGRRELVTAELNTTNNMYLQFTIRVGSFSQVSSCPAPDKTKELVMLDYSCDGGITWTLLKTFNIHEYREAMSDSVLLPEGARDIGCKFRWWQAEHSGREQDVWALDDITLNNHLFNTLHIHMDNLVGIDGKVSVTHGKLSDTYCRKMKSLSFIGDQQPNDVRFLETESMHIGPGYILQFELVMGCGLPYSETIDNRLYLEYSIDHGIHWELVYAPCLPPAPCERIQEGTIYDWTKYRKWTRVTVPLPVTTLGPATRFRLRQSSWTPTDTWAIARLYIGQQCPGLCSGHGECSDGICSCDNGFEGEDCHPATHLNDKMHADFGIRYEPDTDFGQIFGGKVVSNNRGCGNIHSDESLYFNDNGVRELVSKDMDTRKIDTVTYYLRVGGGDRDCNGADERSEGIIFQYSNDGGITWHILDELLGAEFGTASFAYHTLPKEAKTPNTRFRWWQPLHAGKGHDQWAIDEIYMGPFEKLRSLEDDFNSSVEPLDSGKWLSAAGGVIGKYCNSQQPTLILANQEADKKVVTKDMKLEVGDVIQFKINVGCSNQFRWDHPVMLQYWPQGGSGFKLVHEACYPEMECDREYTEASIYHSGPYGHWQLVVIPVTEELAKYPIVLQWFQPGGYPFNFALDDVYIGPPCDDNCNRQGACKKSACSCYTDHHDPSCQSDDPTPYGMVDRFEQMHRPSDFWQRIWGGHLGLGCGTVDTGNALFFDGIGTREAVTVPMNTTYLRMLEFVLKVGSADATHRCTQPTTPNEGIIVDYSTDNEITWHELKVVEPLLYNGTTERVIVELPAGAKSDRTMFRWWQPLGYGGMRRAEWGLDSVTLGVNDTNLDGFQDDFAGMMPDMFTWFQTENAIPRITCNSKGNALEFSRNGANRYAETWDYHVTPSTFLQFDIAMGCDSLYDTLYGVMVEYSTNMGKNWQPVVTECAPPNFECSGYHLESDYMSDQHRNWTRISVYLPSSAVSPATRFRWKQHSQTPSGNVWALDNVYLGDGCPWLCSGHGYCDNGNCICDDGYSGEYCVPSRPLPMMLRDDFNREKPQNDNWNEVFGGYMSTMCGMLVSGNALTFTDDSLRMAVTRDIDTSMLNTVEFTFLYGCNGEKLEWPRQESVLLQYSINGGITWNLLKEMHYRNESEPRFFSLDLPVGAKHNSTRFRFWQPKNSGKMRSTWAVDNLFIGRMMMNPNSMNENFDAGVQSDSWLFVNDGHVGSYCELNTRNDTLDAGVSALVFRHGPDQGERSVVTRDLDVGPMSVLQFDINVGCASEATHKYPVRLEYSSDGGKTWDLLVPNCAERSMALCYDSVLHPSIFYEGTSKYWRRVIIPLDNLFVCGSLRFRWYQGFIPSTDYGPEWAIDNIFIGMACMQHCLGKGDCGDTMMCTCDPDYQGDSCVPSQSYPIYMKEGFPLADSLEDLPDVLPILDSFISPDHFLSENQWDVWGGARVSRDCGLLVDGHSLVFQHSGDRLLVTRELNLNKATTVQFYLRLGCDTTTPDPATPPVYHQYTTDGGITWHTIEQFDFKGDRNEPLYVALNLPAGARSLATQLRWWQPSKDGLFMADWAIDQLYIGGDYDGVPMLSDEPAQPSDPAWTMTPGGTIDNECLSEFEAIKMYGDERHRFAVTADVAVQEGTFLQFSLNMGCSHPKICFSVELQYSLDKGVTWQPVWETCLPSNVDCNKEYYPSSTYFSDTNFGWNRHTIPLPYYTRSKATRFRWYQKEGYSGKDTWSVANMFVGPRDISFWCSGHGRSEPDNCVCDDGWTGYECSQPADSLPEYLYDMFLDESNDWLKMAGGKREKVCKTLASGSALHFTGNCTRVLISKFLDLSSAAFVQFYFMYGCGTTPDRLDESVLLAYSHDGIHWTNFGLLHYLNYRNPTFVTMKLPEDARRNGTQIRFIQLEHSGHNLDDWMIDNVRIGGRLVNPDQMVSDFTDGVDPAEWNTFDNIKVGEYCGQQDIAIGNTKKDESAAITTQDLNVKQGHMMQFWYNIGCMRPWNATVAPIHLQYSTDYGMTWSYITPQCLPNNPGCPAGPMMASVYYGDPMGRWQRVIMPLEGLTLSKATRFRWQQRPISAAEAVTEFGLRGVYIGPACDSLCGGHGNCDPDNYPACTCDAGHTGTNCYPRYVKNPTTLKDVFTQPDIDKSKWSLVQSGTVQDPCTKLVEGSAMVLNGPGMRQLVTTDMDLRDAKFVQYTATVGGLSNAPGCVIPRSHGDSVVLQYSTDGGIQWHTLHTLDYTQYLKPRRDYIKLPQEARTKSAKIRWWQPVSDDPTEIKPTWAIDDVYIGGHEVNPAKFQINFNESLVVNDQPWEFNPYGYIDTEVCKRDDSVIMWDQGSGVRHFTTLQTIVQRDYILQFKIAVGCSHSFNICQPMPPVTLVYNTNPSVDKWYHVTPQCLPDLNQRMDCRPNMFHIASEYTPDAYPTWTRVTVSLPEKTFSSTTRFRWIQDSPDTDAPGWALDDIYVGESCPDMCHGRGDCKGGYCHCDEGYAGDSCIPAKRLYTRLFESFEGGIYTSHWDWVSGGGIGFGCGALLPYAHGKTLYFNGCGLREARTVEMDLRSAGKIIFVLQIGCKAQTPECNVKISDESQYRGVLLQYSNNHGVDWHLVARHDPADHLTPKRVAYDIPSGGRVVGTQFRWWQPIHGGEGHDQWAIDHVEIVPGLAKFRNGRRRREVFRNHP